MFLGFQRSSLTLHPQKIKVVQEESRVSSKRKQDHIELAFESRVAVESLDRRFYYEPMLRAHPPKTLPTINFLGKQLALPIWVSSMTGGTEMGRTINQNLARACAEFGMGMGLGSCRSILYDSTYLSDFDVRSIIGPDLPLFGNLGLAQVEQLIKRKEIDRIDRLIGELQLDGLIVHVNPLQEAFQPEGDVFLSSPIEVITDLMEHTQIPLIVKEVGQGMGPNSLRALLKLPLAAVDFGASGGTNFALLETLRAQSHSVELEPLTRVGHSAIEMVGLVNKIEQELGDGLRCRQVIISGGIQDFLDGYYCMEKLNLPSIYGQASAFLRHAMGNYKDLQQYVQTQKEGLRLASAYLRVK